MELTCKSRSDPGASLRWKKGDEILVEHEFQDNMELQSITYVIDAYSSEDLGKYLRYDYVTRSNYIESRRKEFLMPYGHFFPFTSSIKLTDFTWMTYTETYL